MQNLVQTPNENEGSEIRNGLDQLERKYAKIQVALYELERMNEKLAAILPILRETTMLLDELRSINTAKWKRFTRRQGDAGPVYRERYGNISSSPEILARNSNGGFDLKSYLYDGKFAVEKGIAEQIMERVRIWSSTKTSTPVEWAAVLTGPSGLQNETELKPITGFFELPTYNANKESHLTINMADIEKVDKDYPIVAFVHSHPGGSLVPSLQDWITFTYIDFQVLRRPILYMILSPTGQKVIFSFKECHENMDCPLGMLKAMKGRWQS